MTRSWILLLGVAMIGFMWSALPSASPANPAPPAVAAQTLGCLNPPCVFNGLLLTQGEFDTLPITGETGCDTNCATAWNKILDYADDAVSPDITDNENNHDVVAFANALVWAGSGATSTLGPDNSTMIGRERARSLINAVVGQSYNPAAHGSTALSVGRNLLSYVLAANVINLDNYDDPNTTGDDNDMFRDWILEVAETEDGWTGGGNTGTLQEFHEHEPNNWGAMIGASRMAVEMYLGVAPGSAHRSHMIAAKQVFRGFLGNDTAYNFDTADFGGAGSNEDYSWHADYGTGDLEAIGPVGATSDSHSVDGCFAEDAARIGDSSECSCCPDDPVASIEYWDDYLDRTSTCATGYPWESMQGMTMQAHLLTRCQWGGFTWESSAINRAGSWLYEVYGIRAEDTNNGVVCQSGASASDDTWVPHILEAYYQPSYLTGLLTYGGKAGKNCGFADWWAKAID
jgi:hypothetical protein